jgi:HEAT repeat protein
MSRPRRRMFGPLLYSTLILAVLMIAYTGIVSTLQGDFWRSVRERQEVNDLVGRLRDQDPAVREWSMRHLVTKGPEVALPYLVETARDPNSGSRLLACQLLIHAYADPAIVVPVLVAAARDDRDVVRSEVARDFGPVHAQAGRLTPELKAQSLETLGRLLEDPASEVRAAAAESLGEFAPDPMPIPKLVAATSDKDRTVRSTAAGNLLKFHVDGDRVAIQTLLKLLADPEPVPDRGQVVDILKATRNEVQDQAVTALAKLLSDGDPMIHPDVIDCLQSIGPRARSAVPFLERLLDDDDPILRANVGMAIVAILGKKDPRSIEMLIGIMVDEELPRDWRNRAGESLSQVEPAAMKRATPELIRQLGDDRQDVRLIAHDMLGRIIPATPAEMPKQAEGK